MAYSTPFLLPEGSEFVSDQSNVLEFQSLASTFDSHRVQSQYHHQQPASGASVYSRSQSHMPDSSAMLTLSTAISTAAATNASAIAAHQQAYNPLALHFLPISGADCSNNSPIATSTDDDDGGGGGSVTKRSSTVTPQLNTNNTASLSQHHQYQTKNHLHHHLTTSSSFSQLQIQQDLQQQLNPTTGAHGLFPSLIPTSFTPLSPPQYQQLQYVPAQLWMGDIEPWMDEECIRHLWACVGESVSVKMIRDRITGGPANYCFVEVPSQTEAERVLATYSGQPMPLPYTRPFRLNWASGMSIFSGTSSYTSPGGELPEFSLFVGDLGAEVTDVQLAYEFRCRYTSVRTAKVVTDPATGQPRGYGFVRFSDEGDQQRALIEMQGQLIGSRAIRVSTATPKRSLMAQHQSSSSSGDGSGGGPSSSSISTYYTQGKDNSLSTPRDITGSPSSTASSTSSNASYNPATDPFNTTVFVGGLMHPVGEDELHAFFSVYGEVVYCKIPPNRGCGFVTFARRANAETAMRALNGSILGGSRIRLSWGRSQSHARHNHHRNHHNHQNHHSNHHNRSRYGQNNTTNNSNNNNNNSVSATNSIGYAHQFVNRGTGSAANNSSNTIHYHGQLNRSNSLSDHSIASISKRASSTTLGALQQQITQPVPSSGVNLGLGLGLGLGLNLVSSGNANTNHTLYLTTQSPTVPAPILPGGDGQDAVGNSADDGSSIFATRGRSNNNHGGPKALQTNSHRTLHLSIPGTIGAGNITFSELAGTGIASGGGMTCNNTLSQNQTSPYHNNTMYGAPTMRMCASNVSADISNINSSGGGSNDNSGGGGMGPANTPTFQDQRAVTLGNSYIQPQLHSMLSTPIIAPDACYYSYEASNNGINSVGGDCTGNSGEDTVNIDDIIHQQSKQLLGGGSRFDELHGTHLHHLEHAKQQRLEEGAVDGFHTYMYAGASGTPLSNLVPVTHEQSLVRRLSMLRLKDERDRSVSNSGIYATPSKSSTRGLSFRKDSVNIMSASLSEFPSTIATAPSAERRPSVGVIGQRRVPSKSLRHSMPSSMSTNDIVICSSARLSLTMTDTTDITLSTAKSTPTVASWSFADNASPTKASDFVVTGSHFVAPTPNPSTTTTSNRSSSSSLFFIAQPGSQGDTLKHHSGQENSFSLLNSKES